MRTRSLFLFAALLGACYPEIQSVDQQPLDLPDLAQRKPTLLIEGSDCDDDSQCGSGLCIPVMPVSPRGVCYGATMKTCERSLSPTAWARLTCRALGFTVSVCPRETERCILAPNPTGERYPYQCCETTLFE